MYHQTDYANDRKPVPFRIECTNCGSRDVTATAFEYYDLEITCNCCGSFLTTGSYNENKYSDS